ncbi:MAG: hypothetical protein IJ223_06220 [Clostridia bacterium]|nr:hypothetical protein [Clostridia bacterium]
MKHARKTNQKGITLIALVITIIVLLILAGVALATLTGNSSIIDNANYAVEEYNSSANADQEVLNQVENLFAKYMGESANNNETGDDDDDDDTPVVPLQPTAVVATSGAEITYNANGGTGNINYGFVAPLGNGFKGWNTEADGSGTMYAPGDEVSESGTLYAIWGGTYRLGQEVTINVTKGTETVAESFYVLIDDNTNQAGNVTLLAKYNLDKDPDPNDATTGKYYQKPNAAYSETKCAFSSTNYWSSDWVEGTRMNLNTYTTDAVAAAADPTQTKANNAIMRARDYATSTIGSGAEGRLLTYEEANELQSSYGAMINGTANTNDGGNYLYYWLSSAYESDNNVWNVYGDRGLLGSDRYNYGDYSGVRPVITVSKSLIQ